MGRYLIVLACLITIACSSPGPGAPEAEAPIPRRTGYLAAPLWEIQAGTVAPFPSAEASLGAGHGVVAWLIRDPCQHGTLILHDETHSGAGGPCPDPQVPTTFVNPDHEVVRVGPNGQVWWLGLPKGSVLAHHYHPNRVVTRLPARGPVWAACSSDGQVIAYADSAQPGRLLFHDIALPDSAWAVDLPAEFADPDESEWADVQLGGAPGQPCVLVAPRVGVFAVAQGDSVVWTAPFYEPLPPRPPRRTGFPFFERFRSPPEPPRPGPLDATSFAGGIAVLYQGASAAAGRLVDLYDHAGQYRQTMILPHPALRIASTGTQLVTLSHREARWWLALYWFPGEETDAPAVDTIPAGRVPQGAERR